jgi:hypothetical protein
MYSAATLFCALVLTTPSPSSVLPGFRPSPWFGEHVREEWIAEGVRVLANAPGDFDAKKPTRLILFATPNGNTIEQTLGCGKAPDLDWHFDIQHVAAQIRKLRSLTPGENIVLVVTEAEGLSWPAWKRKYADGPARIRGIVGGVRSWIPGENVRLTLACNSGGGSFLWGFLDGGDTIPDDCDRIVFLDANYSYSDASRHGDKLVAWLQADRRHRLVVIAYDDRKITLNGKLVVGPDGGTFRATERMRARLARDIALIESSFGDFVNRVGADGQVAIHVHTNPGNKILHTALVGEMNGLLRGLTDPDSKLAWETFGGPRAYADRVQPAPGIPQRPAEAPTGSEFFAKIARLTPADREAAIAKEICRGNIPKFLRSFKQVTMQSTDTRGKQHVATLEVMPDYLAVGANTDFVRVPMTPMTAAYIADVFGCALPTRKIVDEIYGSAPVKLEPGPLTKDRESTATFLEHNRIIEVQRAGRHLGDLVAGIKKDVVVSNRLAERPNRVALYGWHKLDGKPIQPLTIVHVNWYVDYSHGIRLIRRAVVVDGVPRDIRPVLYSADLSPLLSDEGPLTRPAY